MRRVGLVLVLMLSSLTCAADPDQPKGKPKDWRTKLTGPPAWRLAKLHPLSTELKNLQAWLLPPKGTPEADVTAVFGKPRIYKAERKQPYDRYVYKIADGFSLNVTYEKKRVKSAWFAHHNHRVRPTPYNLSQGTKLPSYSYNDYLHDLQVSVNDLGTLLVKLQRRQSDVPWLDFPLDGPG